MRTRLITLVLSAVLALASALTGASAAHASPVTTGDWNFYRTGDLSDGSVNMLEGEEGYATFLATIESDWSGWAFPKKKKFTFTTSDFAILDATHDELVAGINFWQGTSSTDPECYKFGYFTTTFVVPKRSCVDTVTYGTEVMVDTSTSSIDLESGLIEATFSGNGRPVTPLDGLSYDIFATVSVPRVTSITVDTATVSDITVETEMCIDESLVSVGDEATRHFTVELDGDPVAETETNLAAWVNWQWTPEDTPVIIEGEEPLQDLTDHAGGWITTVDDGIVTATLSADLTIDGSSILEPCSQDFAGPLDTSGTVGDPGASDSTMSLPTSFSWSDGSTPGMRTDGFGGVFAVESTWDEVNGGENVQLTHLGSSGDNDSFAGDGVVDLDFPSGFASITRWDAGGSKWAATSYFDFESDVLTVVAGSMTTSATTTSEIDRSVLEQYCGRTGAEIDNVEAISAPMDSPLIRIDCHYRASKKNPYAPVTTLALVDTTQDDTLTGAGTYPSLAMTGGSLAYLDVSVNPNATDRESALLVYSQSTKVKGLGTEIRLNSIEPDGTVNYQSLSANPFGTREIQSLDLVAGATEGTWLGYVDQSYLTRRDYVVNHHLVKVTGGESVTLSDPVELTFDGQADVWEHAIVSMNSDTEFGEISFGRSMFDNEAVGNVDLNVWNFATADVSSGETIATVDPTHGYEPLLWSSPGSGNPSFFWITSEDEYQVVTWNLP